MKKFFIILFTIHCSLFTASAQIQTNAGIQYLQAMQKDMSTDFYDLSNTYFLADSLVSFDAEKGEGLVQWKRYRLSPRQAFNLNGYWPVRLQQLDFPDAAYDNDPALKLSIEFITPRTVRVRMLTTPIVPKDNDQDDPMFCEQFKRRATHRDSTHRDWHCCEQGAQRPNYRVPVPRVLPRAPARTSDYIPPSVFLTNSHRDFSGSSQRHARAYYPVPYQAQRVTFYIDGFIFYYSRIRFCAFALLQT